MSGGETKEKKPKQTRDTSGRLVFTAEHRRLRNPLAARFTAGLCCEGNSNSSCAFAPSDCPRVCQRTQRVRVFLRSVTPVASRQNRSSAFTNDVARRSNSPPSQRSVEEDPQKADRISGAGDPVRKQMPINHRRAGALFHSLLTSRDQHAAFSLRASLRSLCNSRKRARCPNYVNLFFVRLT